MVWYHYTKPYWLTACPKDKNPFKFQSLDSKTYTCPYSIQITDPF